MAFDDSTLPSYRSFRIEHALRRRLRISTPALRGSLERGYLLDILLRKHPGVVAYRSIPGLGGAVIEFDPRRLPLHRLCTVLDTILGNLARHEAATRDDAARALSGPVRRHNFALEGMSCASCALLIQLVLRRDPRITRIDVNYAAETAQAEGAIDRDELYALIRRMGYRAHPLDTFRQRLLVAERERRRLADARRRVVIAAVLGGPVALLGMLEINTPWSRLLQFALTTPILFWAGWPSFRKAWRLALQGASSMDTLVALGVGTAYGHSTYALLRGHRDLYFDAAAGILLFILLGRFLEEKAKGKAHDAIRRLVDLQPPTASVLRDGQELQLALDRVVLGDRLLVRPGERIPLDGEVTAGRSSVDESMVTGESLPVLREPGQPVIGGCINGNGVLTVRVTAVGGDTVLARIVHMVEQAQSARMPIQRTVDRISSSFVPAVIAISALSFGGWLLAGASLLFALSSAISVLLIACPCALGLATPAAVMVGTGQAARRGIYIRNGESLETASRISAVVFDKTGTITEGKPQVTDLLPAHGHDLSRILDLALSVESASDHFLGKAIAVHAREQGAAPGEAEHFENLPGRGVLARVGGHQVRIGAGGWMHECGIPLEAWGDTADRLAGQGKTPVYLAVDGEAVALYGVADRARKESPTAIALLRRRGILTLMATGDVERAARHIADQVGIDRVVAQARPEDKLRIVAELKQAGHVVAMAGDGINDAPALAAADVSFAVGSGTDIAMASADMILMQGDIGKVGGGIELSRDTLRVIRQNLFWAFGYNVVAIPVAALGRLTPMMASAAMALSSVSVVLNSLRLQRR